MELKLLNAASSVNGKKHIQITPPSISRVAVTVVALAVICATSVGCSTDDSPTVTASPETPQIKTTEASKLATLDAGVVIFVDDPIVRKYQTQLDSIRATYGGIDEAKISNTVFATQQIMEKKGTDETILSVLSAVNNVSQRTSVPPNLVDFLVTYSTLRVQGLSKEQVIYLSTQNAPTANK